MSASARESYAERLRKLKHGIVFAWIVNLTVLTLVIEAAMVWGFMGKRWSTARIERFLIVTVPLSLVIALVILLIVSWRSSSMILNMTKGAGMVRVTEGTIHDVVEEMATAAGLRTMPSVYVEETTAVNAYAMGTPAESMVVLTRPLVEMMDREELQGVVGHEIGHVVNNDCLEMSKLIAMTSVVGLVSGSAFRMMSYGRDDDDTVNPLAVVLIMLSLALLIAAPMLSLIARQFMSRERESNADALSVKFTRNPEALARALLDIEGVDGRLNGESDSDSDKYYKYAGNLAFWGDDKAMSSHPPTEDRIRALVRMGANPQLLSAFAD